MATAGEALMTAAPVIEDRSGVLATGNEWVALPAIDPVTGAIRTVEVLSMRALGSLGLAASPDPWREEAGRPSGEGDAATPALLSPFVEVDGRRLPFEGARGSAALLEDWVVELRWGWSDLGGAGGVQGADGLEVRATILAPVGHRGFLVRLEAHNASDRSMDLALGLEMKWRHVVYSLFRSRALPVSLRAWQDPWTRALALEASAGWPVIGWAVSMEEPADLVSPTGGSTAGAVESVVGRRQTLGPGARATATFCVSVAPELDGARTTAVDLRRRGWAALLEETLGWLRSRKQHLPDEALERLVNRNLFFTHFFACGRALDTEEWVAVTSRSPRYYVSAAFWARDSLLWSLPGLLRVEPSTARHVLRFAFRHGWKNPGMHAQYINGAVLYPGFELDELAAYPVALGRYLDATGDESILQEPEVRGALGAFPAVLERLAGPGPLYRTFLDPSDDPPPYPYLMYDNALLWRGLVELGRVCGRVGMAHEAAWAEGLARRLHAAIFTHGVVDGPFGPMFAWAVDGQGGHVLYDDPPGSLQLLGVLGVCRHDDPVLLNTIRWVHSIHNPHWYPGPFGEAGCAHSPRPWPMAAANALMAAGDGEVRQRALAMLRGAPMDGGLACETVDPVTGQAASGAAFATAAGYIAAAVVAAYAGSGRRTPTPQGRV